LYPLLTIDLPKIENNARVLVERCRRRGIEIVGVTKCCLGAPQVAAAMLKGGVGCIADSRLGSLRRLSEAGVSPLMMLRQPMREETEEAVCLADTTLISDLDAGIRLSEKAVSAGKEHSVVLMVEVGDLREGILPCEVLEFLKRLQHLPGLRLLGLGANEACLQSKPPTPENLDILLELSKRIKVELDVDMPIISAGNSSAIGMLARDDIPKGINQIRVGEAILLGRDTIDFEPIDGLYQDAFLLSAEVMEVRTKPLYNGVATKCPQALLALGRQDIADGDIKPLFSGPGILTRSSDHLAVNLANCPDPVRAGDILTFIPSYFAVLAAMTSPFVDKKFIT
jgi:predicted amino acid racemase